MGNCASNPKTNEGDDAPVPVPVPETVTEEVKVEQPAETTATEETPQEYSDDKSLGTLLNENGEKTKESEIKEEEAASEKVKPEIEAKPETTEVSPKTEA